MNRTVLVVDTMGGLGDLVLAVPMIRSLARSDPAASVHVVTTAPWHVLLQRDFLIASVTPVPGRDESTTVQVVTDALDRLVPDVAVTTSRLHGLPALLQDRVARTVTDLWRSPPPDELVDRRYTRILVEEGLIEPSLAAAAPEVVLGEDELASARPLLAGAVRPVLLFPDSGMAVKQWATRSWTHVVQGISAAGRTPVVVSQVPEQRHALHAAGAMAAPAVEIRMLAAFCAAAAELDGAAVGGDTGPVRLATAVGLHAVGLYGPTLAARYGLAAGNRDLQGLPGCGVRRPTAITEQACWWSGECPLTTDGSHACMDDIAPHRVLTALQQLESGAA